MATQYPQTPTYPRRRPRGVIGPLVLIFLGCVFLLQNAGYLPPNFWLGLWRLWPVVLVLAGLELLLASRVPWGLLAVLSVVVLIAGTAALTSPGVLGPAGEAVSRTSAVDLAGAQNAALSIRFDAGQLNVTAIEQAPSTELATIAFSGPEDLAPQPRFSVSGGTGQLDIGANVANRGFLPFFSTRSAPQLDIGLTPSVPIRSLNIKSGASSMSLDLSALKVADVEASVGASSTWLRVPQAGATTIHISGGASNVALEVPPGVAARVRFHGGMSTISVDQTRFQSSGDNVYQSSDFGTNPNSADISIDAGLTKIQVS